MTINIVGIILQFYKSIKKYLGTIAILIIAGSYLFYMLNVRFWNMGMGTIAWDTISYYAYLPAKFIYKDISLKFIDKDPDFFSNYVWPEITEEKTYVIKTTMGLAYLYTPFFFAGHYIANHSEYPANGYSLPYHIALAFSGMFYATIGFFFLWRILRRYFPPGISFIVMLTIALATNLFVYTTMSGTMSHSFSFALITFFIWLTIRWYEKENYWLSLLLGLTAGLIILIRPTNVLVAFIFILYGVVSFKDLKNRLNYLDDNWRHILLIVLAAIVIWVPQLIYWKSQTGQLFYFSYGSDERFFWMEPVFFKGLFSFRKGWLIYTPVMIFSFAGLFFMKNKLKEFRLAIAVTLFLAMYVVFSWWCWWYGGGFGMRPMIDYYGMLAIPMGASLSYISSLKINRMAFFSLAFSGSILFGVYHHMQYHYGALHYDSMTWKAYLHSFGHIKADRELELYLEVPDYEKSKTERIKNQ